jgi:hypothetical protein
MESVRESLFYGGFDFELLFALSSFCHFSCHLLVLRLFPLLDDVLELCFDFQSSSCTSWSLRFEIRNSKFVLFVVNVLIKVEIEKPSGQYLGLFVMSH